MFICLYVYMFNVYMFICLYAFEYASENAPSSPQSCLLLYTLKIILSSCF